MKKFFLSAIVILFFGGYIISTRLGGHEGRVIQVTSSPAPIISPLTSGGYRDGSYTGVVADAYYGNMQVIAEISGGRITDVRFLQYPSDRRTSIEINSQAMPYLKEEAIQAQSANVDIVSGATASSIGFRETLASALAQAR